MGKIKLSPWFSIDEKPVHVGVYRTKLMDNGRVVIDGWSLWNGKYWCDTCCNAMEAVCDFAKGEQEKSWQGIVK